MEAAVLLNERTRGPRTQFMENPGQIALPGAGRSEEKDMIVRRPELCGEMAHVLR